MTSHRPARRQVPFTWALGWAFAFALACIAFTALVSIVMWGAR